MENVSVWLTLIKIQHILLEARLKGGRILLANCNRQQQAEMLIEEIGEMYVKSFLHLF